MSWKQYYCSYEKILPMAQSLAKKRRHRGRPRKNEVVNQESSIVNVTLPSKMVIKDFHCSYLL